MYNEYFDRLNWKYFFRTTFKSKIEKDLATTTGGELITEEMIDLAILDLFNKDNNITYIDKNLSVDNFLEESLINYIEGKANDGFRELKQVVDSNNDNVINANDTLFSKLKVWQDENQDGISQANELKIVVNSFNISDKNIKIITKVAS